MLYEFRVCETRFCYMLYRVEADSPEEARELALDGETVDEWLNSEEIHDREIVEGYVPVEDADEEE